METRNETRSFTARWLFPVDGPPLADGTITIRGERIVAVEPKGVRTADHDLGNMALIPGLVNAHTHLDLSGLRGKAQPSADFTSWLRQVIVHRRQCSLEQMYEAIHSGIREAMSFGTTLVGDISSGGVSVLPLATALLRSTVFYELLGLSNDRAAKAWNGAKAWLAESGDERVRRALSPHAPYSVGRWLFEQVAQHDVPVAVHLGERLEELDLLESRSGPFVDFLKELNVWEPANLVESPHEILWLLEHAANLLIIHANYLKPRQIPHGATVVYCPRTHASFGHDQHPFRDFLKAGIRVALGTDSLASNSDLDIFAEAQFVHRWSNVGGAELLRMITLSGAQALGWANETGSLTPGKSADMVGVHLRNQDSSDPYRLLFDSPGSRFVWFRGKLHRATI